MPERLHVSFSFSFRPAPYYRIQLHPDTFHFHLTLPPAVLISPSNFHLSLVMRLLALPVEIWTSHVVPLVDLSSMVRLSGCSRACGDLAHHALQQAFFHAVVTPSDPCACFSWLQSKSISIARLIIDKVHQSALDIAKRSEFETCFREIALKFSEGSTDITGVPDNELWLLLHKKLTKLEIEASAISPVTFMDCCLGCRNLHSITYTMSRWQPAEYNPAWLVQMISVSQKLKKLDIGQRSTFVDEVFAAIVERKDTLTDVTMWIGGSNGSERPEHLQLRKLLQSCPSVRKLSFWAEGGNKKSGGGLVGMEGKCPHLEELVLPNMEFSDYSFTTFLLSCPKLRLCHANDSIIDDQDLEQWHRRGLPKLHDFGVGWSVEQLETVVACAALFEEVRTYHMHCGPYWQTAAEALAYMPHLHTVCLYSRPASILPYVGRHCPQLRVLNFMQYVAPSDTVLRQELIAALAKLPKLEVLQWRFKADFDEAALKALAQHCPNLRSLDCRSADVTDAGLIALLRGCPALRKVVLWHCREGCVTDAFLHAIAQHCPYLEELRLPAWGWRDPPFSYAAVTEVIAACSHLRVLHVDRYLKDGVQASTLVVPAGRLLKLPI